LAAETVNFIKIIRQPKIEETESIIKTLFPEKQVLSARPKREYMTSSLPEGRHWGVYCGPETNFDYKMELPPFDNDLAIMYREKYLKTFFGPRGFYQGTSYYQVPDEWLANDYEGLYKAMQEMANGWDLEFVAIQFIPEGKMFPEGPVFIKFGINTEARIPNGAFLIASSHTRGGQQPLSVIVEYLPDSNTYRVVGGDLNFLWNSRPDHPYLSTVLITPSKIIHYNVPYGQTIDIFTSAGWIQVMAPTLP
jgi:hypothetical protein